MTYKFNNALPPLIILSSIVFAISVVVIGTSKRDTAIIIVDIMNAFLVLISCIFALAIISTLRDKELKYKVRSAQFLGTRKMIRVWTLIGLAIVLYSVTTILYTLEILRSVVIYKLLMTIFGAIFAIAILIQYTILRKYIKNLP